MLEGFYSSADGMLNKLKTTLVPTGTTAYGYILWDPSTTSSISDPGAFNCVLAVTGAGISNPSNTTGNPFGSAEVSGSRKMVGAGSFCQSDTVSDARCVGACIRVTYKGRMDASSGLVAVIDNIPAEAVLGVNGVTPISVDELFSMSTIVERAGIDTMEIKYKPTDYSHVFRSNSEGIFNYATGAVTTISDEAERSGARLMGFAFQGVTSMADFLFEFHQNIEWRPNVDAGFVTKIPKQIHEAGHAQKVVSYLDRNHPGWWTNLSGLVGNGAKQLAKMAFTGVGARLLKQGGEYATRKSLGYLAAEAPLLLTL